MKKLVLVVAALVPAVAFAGAAASKYNTNAPRDKGENYYNAQSAIDGKLETAWVLPGDSVNMGEWIMLDVPKGTVDKLGLVIGWAEDGERFTDHHRVKKVMIEGLCCMGDDKMQSTGTAHAEFKDQTADDVAAAKGNPYALMQIVDIEDIKVGNDYFGGKLKISIVETHAGVDFPNAGISEVMVYMKEFPDPVPAVIKSSTGEGGEKLNDGDKKTFWTSPVKGASFGFSSDSFGLSSFTIEHGPKDHARIKKVKVSAGERVMVQDVADKPGPQRVQIPGMLGYNGITPFEADEIKVEVLEVYPGSKDLVAVSEVTFGASLASEF